MDLRGMFTRVLAALHEAALQEALWPQTSALIDEACGATGNALVVTEGFGKESRIHFRAGYYRGQRNREVEEYYFRNYHHLDERVPRLWRLPEGRLVPVAELYTEQEKKTSPAYNEALPRTGDGNGLAVRLNGPHGTRITWNFADPMPTRRLGGAADRNDRTPDSPRSPVRAGAAGVDLGRSREFLARLPAGQRAGGADRAGPAWTHPAGQCPGR